MTIHPRLPRSGVELVMRFEGLRLKAARLPEGGWIIGYGHTASAREGAEVSPKDAEALLLYDLGRVAAVVDDAVLTPLNDNQFGALTAFAFNVGVENFRHSDVVRRANEGAYLQAAAALETWRRAEFDGVTILVDALVRRRAAEKLLFLTPTDGFRSVPTPLVRPLDDGGGPGPRPGEVATEIALELHGDAVMVTRPREEAETSDDDAPPIVAARSVVARLNAILADEPSPPPFVTASPAPAFRPADETLSPTAADIWAAEPMTGDDGPMSGHWAESSEDEAADRSRRFGEADPFERVPVQTIAVLSLFVFGAALFVGALATIVLGRATLTNLILGLAGVICMGPGAVHLITGRRKPRGRKRAR